MTGISQSKERNCLISMDRMNHWDERSKGNSWEQLWKNAVYIIRMCGTKYYKVGRSQNIRQRMKELQVGNPHKLELVCAIIPEYPHSVDEMELTVREGYSLKPVRGEWVEYNTKSKLNIVDEVWINLRKYDGIIYDFLRNK
jgi:hypothetical protein